MEMKPGSLDVTEQLVPPDPLVMGDGRDDMPVAKRGVTRDDRQRAAALEMYLAGTDGVDGRAVRSRDVDPEMKRPRRARDPRVVEPTANGVRSIERSQRPVVQAFEGTPNARFLSTDAGDTDRSLNPLRPR